MGKSDPNRIREFREQFGFTQAALGEILGTKPATVSHWETGRRQLPDYISKRLSRLRRDMEQTASRDSGQTPVIGEARMSDGELVLYPWDAKVVTVPTPLSNPDDDLRAVILRDVGRNIEINGWLAFFSLNNQIKFNTLSIIKLKGDVGFCGFLRDSGKKHYDVESFFGEKRLENIEIEACYPITWMKAPVEDDATT
jgi:transcriptional regulator with XRE-family HTH domain